MFNPKPVKRMIIVSWVLLFLCMLFKIFSNDLFAIMVKNEKFIEVATYIDSRVWLQSIVYAPYSIIGNYLLFSAIIGERSREKKTTLIVIGICILAHIVKGILLYFLPQYYSIIGTCIDTALIIFVPYAFNKNIITCITGFLIAMGMQATSMLIKNFGIKVIVFDTISSMILAIDVILMYFIYYLYTNFKRGD